jgi:hypothetical protein
VQQARARQVRGVDLASRHDLAAVDFLHRDAARLPRAPRLHGGIGIDHARQLLPLGQFAVRGQSTGRSCHATVRRRQRGAIHIPSLRRFVDQQLARRDGRLGQLRRQERRRARSKGAGVKRHDVGVAHLHADGGQRHAQLVGHRLGERRADVLSQFNLAGARGHAAVGVDVHPRRELASGLAVLGAAP